MLKKYLMPLFLIAVCTFSLLIGCTVNINIGAPSEGVPKETTILESNSNQKTMYESRANILIMNQGTSNTAISSSDLNVSVQLMESYVVILKSSTIQNQVRKEYPGVEYILSLEQINETEAFAIVATSETPEHLEDICNMAVSLFCETLPQVIEGSSCKIVNCAKSTKAVGTK